MIDTPVVWVAPAGEAGTPPSAEAEALLARFAQARGFRLVAPSDGKTTALAADPRVVNDVEASLLAGRDAIARLDGEAIERAAAHALTVLHAHPELPQAAWLAAEAHRLLASRFLRAEPRDAARAGREWRAAAGLDGGRASALGEPESVTPPERVSVPLDRAGLDHVDVAIDGVAVAGASVSLTVGEHHALLRRGTHVVAASWFGVADEAPLRFAPPTPPSCSREDLAHASIGSDGAAAGPGARCDTWLAATTTADGARVAVCNGPTCGTFLDLRRTPGGTGPVVPPRPFPVWIPITIGGVAAVVATGIILWAAGAFDGRATVVRFTQGNVEPSSHLP